MEIDEDNFDEKKKLKSKIKEKEKPDEILTTPIKEKSINNEEHASGNIDNQTPLKLEVSASEDEDYAEGFDEDTGTPQLIDDKDFGLSVMSTTVDEKEMEEILSEIKPEEFLEDKLTMQQQQQEKSKKDSVTALVKEEKKEDENCKKPVANSIATTESSSLPKQPHIVGDAEEPLTAKTPVLDGKNPGGGGDDGGGKILPKPFKFGWKREVVWRIHPSGKEKADIFFISPSGKKLRSRNEVMPYLTKDPDNGFQLEDFNFSREPLGLGEEYEIVRHAKNLSRSSLSLPANDNLSTPQASIGKRVSKPKVPKGASPPPEGWTPTKALKMNNTALQSGTRHSSQTSSSHTPASSSHTSSTSPSASKRTSSHQSSSNSNRSSSSSKSKRASQNADKASSSSSSSHAKKKSEICKAKCLRPKGQVSSSSKMQCKKCSSLFHLECLGIKPEFCVFRTMTNEDKNNSLKKDYLCESCLPSPLISNPPPPSSSKSSSQKSLEKGGKEQKKNDKTTKPLPSLVTMKYPQTIAVVKGKKYVMVTKPVTTIESRPDEDEELKKKMSKSSSRPIKKPKIETNNIPVVPSLINSNQQFAANFFSNVSAGYNALTNIFKYLKIHERSRAASVCKLWCLAAKDPTFWRTVRMKNSKVSDWASFAAALRRGETRHLDLRKMLVSNSRSEDTWQDFIEQIGTVCTLEQIDMCRCSVKVVESLFKTNKNLRILNAVAINDTSLNLENLKDLKHLEELRLRPSDYCKLKSNLKPLQSLSNLKHLSLTGIRNLGTQGVEMLGDLTSLISLELGECGQFENSFPKEILPKITSLRRLRLENNHNNTCDTQTVLEAVASMTHLIQLELVNFDIKPGFDLQLASCKHLRKLLIIPTYISQSATTNNVVLSAVQKVADSLTIFTWGVTIELLRVTALYVDQCDVTSKKEKQQFDECIPVLKPVPGATNLDGDDSKEESIDDDVPQIEILPLERVENILASNLPKTKFVIVKIPYHATCKQHLVE